MSITAARVVRMRSRARREVGLLERRTTQGERGAWVMTAHPGRSQAGRRELKHREGSPREKEHGDVQTQDQYRACKTTELCNLQLLFSL